MGNYHLLTMIVWFLFLYTSVVRIVIVSSYSCSEKCDKKACMVIRASSYQCNEKELLITNDCSFCFEVFNDSHISNRMDFNQFAALVEKHTKMDVTVAIFALKRREINVGAFGIQMENVEEKTYAFFLNNEMVCFFLILKM